MIPNKQVQRQIVKALQQKTGLPFSPNSIRYEENTSSNNGYIRSSKNGLVIGLGKSGKILPDTSFKEYRKHLKALHKMWPDEHPEALHKAATVAHFNEKQNGITPDYNDLLQRNSKKLTANKPDEVKRFYQGKRLHSKLTIPELGSKDPKQLKEYAKHLRPHGIEAISYLHPENFDKHLADNQLDSSKILKTPSHRGILHEGTLYLSRTAPLTTKNGQVEALNSALHMFKKKKAVPPPLPKGPPPLPPKKAVIPPPLPPIPRKTPPPLPT